MIATLPSALPMPVTDRWQPLRLGIRNVWHYDRAEFRFHHGRLILQGANGAGKTKVLELALPFLLDPDLTPRKLSPSESEVRTMWWNLIEPRSDGSTIHQSREGFVWLEFGRRDADGDRYFTLGARLRATASTKAVKAHFFHTTMRIGVDLPIGIRVGDGERERAANSVELRAAIGETGNVTESRNEHRATVDATLFGLGTRYEGLITLLRALRRPKLSEKLKLPELKSYMADALPPVPDEVIERQAEVFDGLRQDEAELAEAKRAYDRVQRFLRIYEGYARRESAAVANEVRTADVGVREAREEIRRASDAAKTAGDHVVAHELKELAVQDELDALAGRLDAVRSSPEMREAKGIADAATRAADAERRATDDAARSTRATETSDKALRQAERYEIRAGEATTERTEAGSALRFDAVRLGLTRTVERVESAGAGERHARRLVDDTTRTRSEELKGVRRRARAADDAGRESAAARKRLSAAEAELEAAIKAEAHAAIAREGALAHVRASIGQWMEGLSELRAAPADRERLEQAIEAGESLTSVATELAQSQRNELLLAGAAAERRVADTTAEIRSAASRALAVRTTPTIRPPADPVLPSSRAGRAGGAFYDLVDFRDEIPEDERAGLEAALTGAGLLDAWVDPSGAVLASDLFDASVLGTGPIGGAKLAEALRPVGGAVSEKRISRVLASIGLGASSGSTTWVDVDGAFGIGERAGRATKPAAAFVGATARANERRRTWQGLRAEVASLRARRGGEREQLASIEAQADRISEDLKALPTDAPVIAAGKALEAAIARHEAVAGQVTSASTTLTTAEDLERVAVGALELAAKLAAVDLAADIDELVDAVTSFRAAALRLVDLIRDERAAAETARERGREATELRRAAESTAASAEESRKQATTLRGTADQLAASASDDAKTIVAREQELVREQRERVDEQKRLRSAGKTVRDAATAADLRRESAEAAEQPALDRRDAAAAAFARYAETGLLALAITLTAADGAPSSWTQTDALEVSRRVDTSEPESFALAAVNAAAAAVQNGIRALQAELPASDFGSLITDDGYHVVTGRVGDELLSIGRVAPLLADDIRQREEAFAEQHREAARRFLLEGAGDALSERIRAAQRLVEETSIELRRHETASGHHLRLRWTPSPEMPPETAHVVALLQKHPGDLRDEDRIVIADFLRGRIDEASRLADEVGFASALEEQLDYRRWHVFRLDRFDGHRYDELTTRNFSAGSEGERAVELHLPLFAAAAAFYNSARPTAPRLVMLDEAFSGIDEDMRASMFGITAAFGLDLVITSPDEWGTYPTVDGCSIYVLKREPDGGPRGVLARRFVWTGRERLDERELAAAGIV